MSRGRFSEKIDRSIREREIAGREKKAFWRYVATLGIGGWLFVMPVIGGAFLGNYVDSRVETPVSWTLILIFAGILVGAFNVCYYLIRRSGD